MTSIRSIATRLVLITGVASTLLASGAAPVSAYTPYASGYPGSASVPAIYGASTGFAEGAVTFPARTATESTRYATSNQLVCVTMELVYAMGAKYWITYNSVRNCAWIPAAATSAAISGVTFTGLPGMGTAIFAGNVTITWQLANGTLIGSRVYDYDIAGDYRCSTSYCGIGNTTWGGGAYLTFTR